MHAKMDGSKPLNETDRMRYARHLSLPGFGEEAQSRLKSGSVLVIGAGGLGSPVCLYLAAAGVGRIGVMDGDRVDESNLQRQVIHSTADIGMPKVESAARRMLALNPYVDVATYDFRFTADNAMTMLDEYDFVIDATDSIQAKFLINDMCVAANKPFSHGAIYRYCGHTMTYKPGSACYRCLFDTMPDPVETSGPLGVLPGIIGTIQASEAVKYLAGVGDLLIGSLFTVDTLTMTTARIAVPRRNDCGACGGFADLM